MNTASSKAMASLYDGQRSQNTQTTMTAPGLRQRWRLPYGVLKQARQDPLRFYCDMARRFGDVFRWDVGSMRFYLLSHPDYVKHVLHDHAHNYPRSRFHKLMRVAIGDGLVNSEGERWRRHRQVVQPAFHRSRVASLTTLMTDAIRNMLDAWECNAQSGERLDVGGEMMRVALCIVGKALFDRDISADTSEFGQAVNETMHYLNYRIRHLLAPPLFVPTPRNLRFLHFRRTVNRLIYRMIAQRRAEANDSNDLLAMLLAARDKETGEPMSDQAVRDETVTFLSAGHETTAVALTWTWYLLSRHPEVERRVRAEVDRVLGDRTPAFEDLSGLSLVRQVIEESMRLYPPVWMMTRDATNDDAVGGYRIPAGSLILLSPYVTHRHPEFWPNPEGFDPDRFSPEQTANRPRFAYFPFGGGPHSCIGSEFAMMEATLIVAMTMQRFRVELVAGHPVIPDPIFTLRQKYGVFVTLKSAAGAMASAKVDSPS